MVSIKCALGFHKWKFSIKSKYGKWECYSLRICERCGRREYLRYVGENLWGVMLEYWYDVNTPVAKAVGVPISLLKM